MPTTDLFGNIIPDKTEEEEYNEYIASPAWKIKRVQALERTGYKCEECGMSKYTVKLEVHHLHYDRFKKERPEDLIVVCEKCHKKKDRQRERETIVKNYAKLQDARLDGWATKVFGEDWEMLDPQYVNDNFEAWLSEKGEL